LYITFYFSHLIIYNFPLSIHLHLLTSVCFILLPLAFFHFCPFFSCLLTFICLRLHFSTTIWVILKCKRMQNKTYYSAIFNLYILFVRHVLFLSFKHLEISIKHSFTSSDYCLLYLASACFLSLPFIFFTSVGFRLRPFAFHLHSFASICVLVPP